MTTAYHELINRALTGLDCELVWVNHLLDNMEDDPKEIKRVRQAVQKAARHLNSVLMSCENNLRNP